MNCSRQSINNSKTTAFISKNTHPQTVLSILDTLRLKKLPAKTKHFGLLILPQNKNETFKAIKDRVTTKLVSWQAKLLSQEAARTTLIKWLPHPTCTTCSPFFSPKISATTLIRCYEILVGLQTQQ